MKTFIKPFIVGEKFEKYSCASNTRLRAFSIPVARLLAGGRVHDRDHEGLTIPSDRSHANFVARTPALAWCRTVAVTQWSLRNTARPRRSPAMPAPGSAFMVLARPMAVH